MLAWDCEPPLNSTELLPLSELPDALFMTDVGSHHIAEVNGWHGDTMPE
jgi:hypothetical protein